MTDLLAIGETMVSLRSPGPVRVGGEVRLSIAGAESNVAIGLARLGHRVRWAGVTGNDESGALILRTLRAEAVDVSTCRVEPGAPTGLVLFETRLAGVTRVSYYRDHSAGSTLSVSDVVAAFSAGAPPRWLHITGVTPALGAGPSEAVQAALKLARDAGTTTCLDVNFRSRLWSRLDAATTLRALLPSIDVLFASDDELAIAVGADANPVQRALDAGVAEVVVKHGAEGASVHNRHGVLSRRARDVSVVDTIGAGDAFVAGYLSAAIDGLEPVNRLERAVDIAAFAVATVGDWEGLPTRSDLGLLGTPPGSALR